MVNQQYKPVVLVGSNFRANLLYKICFVCVNLNNLSCICIMFQPGQPAVHNKPMMQLIQVCASLMHAMCKDDMVRQAIRNNNMIPLMMQVQIVDSM